MRAYHSSVVVLRAFAVDEIVQLRCDAQDAVDAGDRVDDVDREDRQLTWPDALQTDETRGREEKSLTDYSAQTEGTEEVHGLVLEQRQDNFRTPRRTMSLSRWTRMIHTLLTVPCTMHTTVSTRYGTKNVRVS